MICLHLESLCARYLFAKRSLMTFITALMGVRRGSQWMWLRNEDFSYFRRAIEDSLFYIFHFDSKGKWWIGGVQTNGGKGNGFSLLPVYLFYIIYIILLFFLFKKEFAISSIINAICELEERNKTLEAEMKVMRYIILL